MGGVARDRRSESTLAGQKSQGREPADGRQRVANRAPYFRSHVFAPNQGRTLWRNLSSRPRNAQFPRRISRRPYAPFRKVRVRFGLLSLLRRVRWIALGALCAKGLWCRNAQANAATVPPMRSLRQYLNVMFDTLALCEHTECRMPTDRVLVSQISIGRWDRESLQQDRKHRQFASWVRRVFSASFFFKKA